MAEPRRLNVVTMFLLAGLVAGGYWLWKFFPVYYTAWQVDHLLAEAGGQLYQAARQAEPQRDARTREVEAATRDKVVALGVPDPELTVRVEMDATTATVFCDYTAPVVHPLGIKPTLLSLHRKAQTDVRAVKW